MEDVVASSNPGVLVLTNLGRKFVTGGKLTMAENLMALSAAAATTADSYGPGPATMVVKTPELPESVKGLLANYAG